jgi:hypothetical protein
MNPMMPRRSFLATSLAAVGAASLSAISRAAEQPQGAREIIELRVYTIKKGPMLERAHGYFKDAFIPAARKLGTGPVGVFEADYQEKINADKEQVLVHVLMTQPSVEAAFAFDSKLLADADYQKAGAAYLGAKQAEKDVPYLNLDTRLMLAAEFMPKMEFIEKGPNRVFQLRRYRSPSEPAFRNKLDMFGKLGELDLFRRSGMNPIIFSEMIAGPDMPNITYMLGFADDAAQKAGWGKFVSSPEWKKMSKTPGYTDAEVIANFPGAVTPGITNIILRPAAYSQI